MTSSVIPRHVDAIPTLRDRPEPLKLPDIDLELAGKFIAAESLSQKIDLVERWLPVIKNRMVNAEKAYERACAKVRLSVRQADRFRRFKTTPTILESIVIEAHENDPALRSLYIEFVNALARFEFLKAEHKVVGRAYRREVFGDKV